MTETPIVVFDCVVFVQALLSKSGPAARCIELVDLKRIRLVMSQPVLTEIRNTLESLSSSLENPLLSESKIESLIDFLLETAEFVDDVPKHFEYPRDPKDEAYINLAVQTGKFHRDRDRIAPFLSDFPTCERLPQRFRASAIKIL